MHRVLVCALICELATACAGPGLGDDEQSATVCGDGPTVKGIDVSYYQGDVDWAAVRADGVEFAFIRATDGLGYIDNTFTRNWAGAQGQGILRGAYQFFRPAQDPIAQAELLLGMLPPPSPGDLPPVIDVESDGDLPPEDVEAAVRAWVDHVRTAIGREPIIYTGFYFWRDNVGAADLTASPLWHAQYTTAECPTIAPPWQDWAFWQFTSMGAVAGITGDVDVNRWNGTREQLDAFASEGVRPCGMIGAAGGEVDDGDACFTGGGPPQYLRAIEQAGVGGDLLWTHTTDDTAEVSYGHWELVLAERGRYRVEVSTPAPYAQSRRARYLVKSDGVIYERVIDQTAGDGWQLLGELDFAAGGGQFVHVGDNTGEPGSDDIQLVFDAVRLTRLDASSTEPRDDDPSDDAGCSAAGGTGAVVTAAPLLGALVVIARRRRRPQ